MKKATVHGFILIFFVANIIFAAPKHILILHQFRSTDPWAGKIDEGFRNEILLTNKVKVTSYFWDDHKGDISKLVEKTKLLKPDLVVIDDDTLAENLAPKIIDLGIPLFFVGIVQTLEKISWHVKGKSTGVLQNIRVYDTWRLLQEITPAKSLCSLGGDGLSTRILVENVAEQFKKKNETIKEQVLVENYTQWKKEILSMQSKCDAILLLLPFHVIDEETKEPLNWKKAGEFIRKHNRKPTLGVASVFGPIERFVSYAIPPQTMGRQLAVMVNKALSGKNLSDIHPENFRFHSLEINLEEAKKLHLLHEIPKKYLGVTFHD